MPTIPAWIGIAVGWAIAGAALWKGGRSERIVAAAFLVAWLVTAVTRDRHFAGPQWSGFVIDAAFLVVLLGVALRSVRYWPLFAAGFQLLAVLTHAARVIDPTVGGWAYITAGVIWTYFTLFALAAGTWGAWRDRLAASPALSPSA